MAIIKVTPGELHEWGMTYVVVPSVVVNALKGDALAVYVHLMNKPADWIPRPKEIQRELGMGRQRYRKAKAELAEWGIALDEVMRDESGHITDRVLTIEGLPVDMISETSTVATETCPTVSTVTTETGLSVAETRTVATGYRRTGFASDGKTVPIHITELINITDSTECAADADARPPSDNSEYLEAKPPSEEKTFYDQGHFVERCIREGISPSLEDLKHLNSRNWVVNGERLTLDAYIQERKA